jgi:hypothetical protein
VPLSKIDPPVVLPVTAVNAPVEGIVVVIPVVPPSTMGELPHVEVPVNSMIVPEVPVPHPLPLTVVQDSGTIWLDGVPAVSTCPFVGAVVGNW